MTMQRLCAVMTGTDRNIVRIENRGNVMRMNVINRKEKDAVMRVRRVSADDMNMRDLLHFCKGKRGQFVLSPLDLRKAQRVQITDRGMQSGCTAGIDSSGFKFVR